MRTIPVALLALASCSLAVMETDPKWTSSEDREPRCTSTKGWAAVDGVSGAAWVVTAIASVALRTESTSGGAAAVGSQNDTLTILTAVSVIGAIVEFASAGVGAARADRCELQRSEHDRVSDQLRDVRENEADAQRRAPQPTGEALAPAK